MNTVLKHLEKQLGKEALRSSARSNDTGSLLDVSISLFNDQPATDAFTLASVGLSNKIFMQPDNKQVRHEILFCAYNKFRTDAIYEKLFDVLDYLLEQDEAISLGQLFDCEGPVASNSSMEGFLFYTPVYFDEALHVIETMKPHVILAWLIPIHRSELEFIAENGPDAFDALLGEHDPDLLDLSREAIV